MQHEVATLDADDTLDLAADVMRLGRVRHFPILAGSKLVGVLSQRDLFRAAASSLLQLRYDVSREWLAKIPVKAVMSTTVHAIAPDRPVVEAVDTMIAEKIGCLPVLENDQLVGLLSETDCLRHLAHLLRMAETRDGHTTPPGSE